jgi:hypothetical protein
MFKTWDLTAEQLNENLAMGETSIDIKGRIADALLPTQILRPKPRLVFIQNANDLFFREP